MRITVFTDYRYVRRSDGIWTERAFALFLNEIARHHELTVVGREGAEGQVSPRYRLADEIAFAGMPFYESLATPGTALRTLPTALRAFTRASAHADIAWILGPNPIALAFVLGARARRVPVVLGVRSDLPAYVASRYPSRRAFIAAANAMETAWRRLARRLPCVVVGPQLAEAYRASRSLHVLTVSLVRERDVTAGPAAASASGHELLSVGRLDSEKDPLLLLDVLARLRSTDARWSVRICGEGTLRGALEERAHQLGLDDAVRFEGYVQFGETLLELYRHSDALVVPSRSEGVPQTIVEALASGLPVVSTDVGGIRATFGDTVALVAPGDADAIADRLLRLERDPGERQRMAIAGRVVVHAHTLEAESARLGAFFESAARR